jgi:hypothetical protein
MKVLPLEFRKETLNTRQRLKTKVELAIKFSPPRILSGSATGHDDTQKGGHPQPLPCLSLLLSLQSLSLLLRQPAGRPCDPCPLRPDPVPSTLDLRPPEASLSACSSGRLALVLAFVAVGVCSAMSCAGCGGSGRGPSPACGY